jgi:hypothetical protein
MLCGPIAQLLFTQDRFEGNLYFARRLNLKQIDILFAEASVM